MNWKIYYANNSTFSDEDGEPEDAPGLGVEVIIQKHEDTRIGAYLQHHGDYYVWWDNKWWACDYDSYFEYIFVDKFPHPKTALKGKMLSNKDYDLIIRRAKADKDFFE